MKISGWGRYPTIDTNAFVPADIVGWKAALKAHSGIIARGLGRSYGDSANGPIVLQSDYLDHYINFDAHQGILQCEAGLSLHQVLNCIIPKGWFLPVTPGSGYVTIGGAVASDVHGKNHHISGTFGDHVISLELLLGSGEVLEVSRSQHPELFYATCGGMGLTGVILSVSIKLKAIQSTLINQTTIKVANLEEILNQFEVHQRSTYSVAWIDCLAKGSQLGRSILMLGEHASEGGLSLSHPRNLAVPVNMPSALLNRYSIAAFNSLYYERAKKSPHKNKVTYMNYFYPLDSLQNWNRLYGKKGFIQYQFVLPKASGYVGIRDILERISDAGKGSFLAVLKGFGPQNSNYLSFPFEGYTLALDFKAEQSTFDLIKSLDPLVVSYGGRIYLAKDALMSQETFKRGYPRWVEFEEIRRKYYALGKFASSQSRRLGLA
jgi:decaprenylphospho-beta-D-ribofuranose 2-oxidase